MSEASPKNVDPAKKWTIRLLIICVIIWVWHLFADRITPYNEYGRVRTFVTPIAPQVSGKIVKVGVDFTQKVKSGDVLFEIDPVPYQLALQQAQAAYDQAVQNIGASGDAVVTAEAKLTQAQSNLEYYETEGNRYRILFNKGVVSAADLAKADAQIDKAKTDVVRADAELRAAQQKIGDMGEDNPIIRQAFAALRQASLDLTRTTVKAPADGAVTNAIFSVGQYANVGQPMMTFLDTRIVWVESYLRENSLGRIKPGNSVDIALDAAPGKVFSGKVSYITYGVNWNKTGQSASALPTISVNEGWLRDSQRFPVSIVFDKGEAIGHQFEGGQADIVVYTGKNFLFNAIGWMQIRLMSWLSYLN